MRETLTDPHWRVRLENQVLSWAPAAAPNPDRLSAAWRWRRGILDRVAWRVARLRAARPFDYRWSQGCLTFGLAVASRNGSDAATHALLVVLDRQLTADGNWRHAFGHSDQLLSGYGAIYAAMSANRPAHRRALDSLFAASELLPRATDGAILYSPGGREVLVDSIGMCCPFLAAYGAFAGQAAAIHQALVQVRTFLAHDVCEVTGLPFHGYTSGGSHRLGPIGWGRGVGWYLIGLVEIAGVLPDDHPDRGMIEEAFRRTARSLTAAQRPSGHWGQHVLLSSSRDDSSATAFCAYALARALHLGILGAGTMPAISAAVAALGAATDRHGFVGASSGEAQGINAYGDAFGVHAWTQGMALAAASEYAALQSRV